MEETYKKKLLLVNFMHSILNNALFLDPEGVSKLLDQKVETTQALAEHPYITVNAENEEHPKLSFLGLINGFIGGVTDNKARIAAILDEDDKLVKFEVVDGPNEKEETLVQL